MRMTRRALSTRYWCSLNLTPKVLANSSPGFALKPWGGMPFGLVATLKELRERDVIAT